MAGVRGEIPNLTFGDLLDRYERDVSATKKGARWEGVRITLLKRDTLASVKLRKLDASDVATWRDRRLKGVSGASVRREWNLLSHACNIAVREWRWLKQNPFKEVRRPKSPQGRDRLIGAADLKALQEVATTPTRQRVFAALRFAIETGMRVSELCGLESITGTTAKLSDTKNGTSREVPLSPEAVRIWGEFGPFGLTPANLDAIWRKMVKESKIKGLHFHDSRHTAITQLAGKLDVLELARMVGIRDLRVLMVYFNKSAEDIAKKL
jgi:integrase